MIKLVQTVVLILISTNVILGQNETIVYLNLPQRPTNALEGSVFVNQVTNLNIINRERVVVSEILSGNVPTFSRKLKAITINKTINGNSHELVFFSVLDYMAIGSDQDYFYIPMTPSTAQYLADRVHCILPTKKIVDEIYNRAELKLRPRSGPQKLDIGLGVKNSLT